MRIQRQGAVMFTIGVLFLVMLQGCAHKTPEYVLQPNGKTALLVRTPAGRETLEIPGRGVLAEAGRGTAVGAGMGAHVGGVVCGPLCLPAVIPLAAVGAMGGALLGGAVAYPQGMWDDAEIAFRTALAELEIDRILAKEIVAYAHAHGYDVHVPSVGIGLEGTLPYEALAHEGFGALLEISSPLVTLVPAELQVNPSRQFTVLANIRLIRIVDTSVLVDRIVFSDPGPTRTIEEWMADNARAFREDTTRASLWLADNIIAELFMVHRFSEQIVHLGLFDARVSGLKPFYPPLLTSKQPPESDSLRPTMKWEPFAADHVTYDLRIWRSIGGNIGGVVYNREGLVDTRHTLDAPLEPSKNYFWSVRAHFIKEGKGRVTEWSRCRYSMPEVFDILTLGLMPSPVTFYQFKTRPNPRGD